MSIAEAARAAKGTARGADVRFDSVSSDSRTLDRGALFVALRGERFDGHAFLGQARERGAVAAMVEMDQGPGTGEPEIPCVIVANTRTALGELAAQWRSRFSIPLIAITGSNGKTTVKEMIAAILREQWGEEQTLATEGNLNNDIGLPLMLLRLRERHRCAVLELGMNHPGETAYLARVAKPTVGLINNAQREHQEFLNGVAEVAREHGALLSALAPDGTAVFNADDEFAGLWRALAGNRPVRDFGLERAAAISGRFQLAGFGSEIAVIAPEGEARATLSVPGVHNVRNALAATAGATAAGAALRAVERGLSAFRAVKGRLEHKKGRCGATVIDDSYNANPDSVDAAIAVLAQTRGPRILVLGDMGEVGERGPAFHEEAGRRAREAGIERLLAVGPLAVYAVRSFGRQATHFQDVGALVRGMEAELAPDVTVLVKGSRFMRMERVVAALVEEGP